MPQQPNIASENNFSKGLITEATGLNFPENAVTDADNCVFHRIGNVTMRPAFDYETNFHLETKDRTSKAISLYKWNNAGGDGSTQIVVNQVGHTLYFYKSSSTTTTVGLSSTLLGTLDISTYKTISSMDDTECQYADGNGYLFVFHPGMTTIYVTYTAPATFTATPINIQIRDLEGITEPGVKDQDRPATLSIEHQYNLQNQGWSAAPLWSASSSSTVTVAVGSRTFTVATGLTTTPGQIVQINGIIGGGFTIAMNGTLTSYNSGTGVMVINVTSVVNSTGFITTFSSWSLYPYNAGLIDTWHTAEGNYPSNSDIWWRFKDDTGTFAPATTQPNVTLNAGAAPKGYYILDAFNQDRQTVSGIVGLTGLTTTARPRAGAWFQGRLWYAGVDGSQAATGDQGHYSWTENIYFSQTIIKTDQFGKCYQVNDPTTDTLFAELPTDGGVIVIQGAGVIQKLFPLQNGLLVFATNGIWYVTGSQGIGFAANDYTVNSISNIQTVSHTSFVNVQGFPMWWNSDGIYMVSPDSNNVGYGPGRGASGTGGLSVQPITYMNVKSFYDDISHVSKRYAHGAFDPINWEVRWLYKSTEEVSVTDRYTYDRLLTYNLATQAFSPWSIPAATVPTVSGIIYVQDPGVANAADPKFKYYASVGTATTFANEVASAGLDWEGAGHPISFYSYFIVGYKLPGQASHKFQITKLTLLLNNIQSLGYRVQGIWDYAYPFVDSNRRTTRESVIGTSPATFRLIRRQHKMRGRGYVIQFKIDSIPGYLFDIVGWVADEKINQGL